MTTTQIRPGAPCPTCGKLLDGHTGVGHDATPAVGDLTVCAYCGAFLQYTQALDLTPLTEPEFDALDPVSKKALVDAGMIARAVNAQIAAERAAKRRFGS